MIPAETGAGKFDILIQARDLNNDRQFLDPLGIQCYQIGEKAWLGSVNIIPVIIPADSKWEEISISKSKLPRDTILMPSKTFHIAEQTELTINLDNPEKITGFALISHLSCVFEEIPFETTIAEISLHSDAQCTSFPIIIGRHTAEAMYEFSGKEVKLSHTHPEIIHKVPGIVDWPVQIENIEYDVLYYWTEFSLKSGLEVDKFTVRSFQFPGVWNVYSIVLIREL
ncbi:hypothetical protein K8T06_07865 [bacterium]|nr:hypothetical protein [bacterium]